MSTPPIATISHLDDTTPVASTGYRNAKWQQSAPYQASFVYNGLTEEGTFRDISAEVPNLGGVRSSTAGTDTVALADQGKMVTFSNSGGVAVALDSTVPNFFFAAVKNIGSGTVVLTPSSGTIDGQVSINLLVLQGCFLFFNGTNWWVIPDPTANSGLAPSASAYILGVQDYADLPNSVAIPDLFNGPDVQPVIAGSLDDEFPGSSLSGSWTWLQQGAATATVSGSRLELLGDYTQISAKNVMRGIYKTAPATPWEVTAQICLSWNGNSPIYCGLMLYESSSGDQVFFGPQSSGGFPGTYIAYGSLGNPVQNALVNAAILCQDIYLRIKDDGTNLTYSTSLDGVSFVQLFQQARNTHFATGPNAIGYGVELHNSGVVGGVNSKWFRRTL